MCVSASIWEGCHYSLSYSSSCSCLNAWASIKYSDSLLIMPASCAKPANLSHQMTKIDWIKYRKVLNIPSLHIVLSWENTQKGSCINH